jgi:MFS family permease
VTTSEPTTAATTAPPEPPEQRRTLITLVLAQIFSGAGLAAGVTVGALLAEDMLDTSSLAGLPSALFTIGSAAAAVSVGRVSQRLGRRAGLSAGYAAGALGSLGVVIAAAADNIGLLFVSLFIYGAGTATNLQARYAGADLASPARRGRAVSTVLVATTVGAVVGPNMVTATGRFAESIDVPALAGPFMLAGLAYAAAGFVLWVLLRPDPLLLARRHAEEASAAARASGNTAPGPASGRASGWSPAVAVGAGIQVLTQLIMVAIMTMTPVYMQHNGHAVGAAGAVIATHIAAMYLPSPLSGWLVDRFGRLTIAVASGLTLLSAGLLAAFAPSESVFLLAIALGLLGLGWNLGLVSGTAVITDTVPLATRARTQGSVDLCIAIAGAGGGLGSGLVVHASSYATLAVGGGVLALAIIPFVAFTKPRSTAAAGVSS